MRSIDDILAKAGQLRADYGERDKSYQHLWYAYNGEFDKISPNYAIDDGTDRRKTQEANIQVWNLVQPIVQTKEVLLNVQPGVNVPAPEFGNPAAAGKAEKIEKALYALDDMGRFRRKHGQASFNLALYYATIWQIVWDEEKEIPMKTTRLPGETYPVMKKNGEDVAYCIFRTMSTVDELAENYPAIKDKLLTGQRGSSTVEVYEYVDDERRMMIVGGKSASMLPEGGEHKLGICPVIVTPGMYIQGETFPRGPVYQLLAVNDHYNRFHTKWGDALEESLFGHHVVKSDGRPPINTGPGAVIYIQPDEDYDYRQPQAPPPEAFHYLQEVRRHMRDLGTWPETASGEMDASVITGKAVTRLQGVMAATAAEAQANMGLDISLANSIMLRMLEKYRPDKKFTLYATDPIAPSSAFDAAFGKKRPSNFTIEIIPSEDIQGYYPNQIVYSPFGTDMNAAIQMGMQLVHERVGSRRWLRNQIPSIGDAEGMDEEIREEDRERAQFEADLQVQVQERIMEAQYQQEARMQQLQQQGAASPSAPGSEVAPQPQGGPAPLPQNLGPNALVMPGGQPQMIGMGEPLTGEEGFPMEYTAVKPFGPALQALTGEGGQPQGPQGEALPGRTVIRFEEAQGALSGVQKLKGRVYLMGEIVPIEAGGRGWTDGMVEVGITNKLDKQTILNTIRETTLFGRIEWRELPPNAPPPEGAVPITANEGAPLEVGVS